MKSYARMAARAALLPVLPLAFLAFGQPHEILKVNANPGAGFEWPYYLGIPIQVKTPAVLLVEPNNTGTVNDDPQYHDDAARRMIINTSYFASPLGSPLLMPAFPRPSAAAAGYTHALDRTALLTKVAKLERIDLQLLAMVEDARARLSARGIQIDDKFWMRGFSASGSFVSRFVVLHPDRVKAASIGASGFGPTLPVAEWKGQRLEFHLGVADLAALVGRAFDAEGFARLPLQVYVGDADDNIVPWFDLTRDKEVALIDELFGGPDSFYRWPGYEAAFRSVSANAQFVIFPGMGHSWPASTYITDFFERNRYNPRPALRKPVNFQAVFPYVAGGPQESTEFTLINTSEVTIIGQLAGFEAEGGESLASFRIQIAPLSRRSVSMNSLFPDPGRIRYVTFMADAGFLSGYATVARGSERLKIPLAARVSAGELAAPPGMTASRLLLLNATQTPAKVDVSAFAEDGSETLFTRVEVESGAQIFDSPQAVLGSGASGAVRFRFSANQAIAACLLAGGQGSPAVVVLPQTAYAR